jgi:glycosyltransferase involved in cell wall biosynthesis
MHILFVIKSLSTPGGGAERVLTTIAGSLADRGHRVTVLSFDQPGNTDFYKVSPGVQRIRQAVGRTAKRSNWLEVAKRLIAVRGVANSLQPDLAVGFMHSSFVPLAFGLIGTGIPAIACERISYDYYRSRLLENAALRMSAFAVNKITINSRTAFTSFPPAIRHKMAIIPNAVGTAAALADPIGGPMKTILTVGSLRPQKDQRTLLHAFANLTRRHTDWRLRIVGEGELRSSLEPLAERLGLQEKVQFAGPTASVEAEYEQAQLFVLPSLYEGFPNSLAEALAHGLPAVGFADCPGTNELIRSGVNGILAEGTDRVDALAAALDPLMASPTRRCELGRAAVASVARYSLESIVDQWEELLRSAVKGSAGVRQSR